MGIAVDGLTKTYSGFLRRHLVLRGVSFETAPGECLGIVGPNGAGKSTVLLCLAGLVRPTSGRILVDGFHPDDLRAKRHMAFVPERRRFDRRFSPQTLLEYLGTLSGLSGAERARRIPELLADFELSETRTRSLGRFSSGMLQRVSLAQAFLTVSAYVLLDEPATGLDPRGAIVLRHHLLKLKARGTSIVMSSHNLTELAKICDRVVFLDSGRIVQDQIVGSMDLESLFLARDEPSDRP